MAFLLWLWNGQPRGHNCGESQWHVIIIQYSQLDIFMLVKEELNVTVNWHQKHNICLRVDMPMTHFSFKRYLVLNPVRLIWHCSWRARWLRILWFRNWQEKVAPGKVLCHPHTAKALCLLPATYISKPVPPAILKSSYPQNSESDVNRGHRCLKSYQGHFENIIV